MNPTPTVHVVEDDPAMTSALCVLIKTMGFTVESYASAEEFLRMYRSRDPECLVLDIRLPGMSGLELQRELTKSGVSLPIIFITGHGDPVIAATAKRQGSVSYLEKPFPSQTLCQSIREAITLRP
ncbi:MAG TPA: response regulator [Thermoguttaceae bacterium]|nr:response regulator [Thermoguttaceae bacterium]